MAPKYYAAEDKRHSKAKGIKLTQKEVIQATKKLFYHYDLETIDIRFGHHGTGNYMFSWFCPGIEGGIPHLSYGMGMLNVLTVAHEVAHYVRHVQQLIDLTIYWRKVVSDNKRPKAPKIRWHDYKHAKITDEAVQFLLDNGFQKKDNKKSTRSRK